MTFLNIYRLSSKGQTKPLSSKPLLAKPAEPKLFKLWLNPALSLASIAKSYIYTQ